MIRAFAAALALTMSAAALTPPSAFAGSSGNQRHYGPVPQSYNGVTQGEPPEAYSNCLAYSPKLRADVWVCGPPYPPGIPALH